VVHPTGKTGLTSAVAVLPLMSCESGSPRDLGMTSCPICFRDVLLRIQGRCLLSAISLTRSRFPRLVTSLRRFAEV